MKKKCVPLMRAKKATKVMDGPRASFEGFIVAVKETKWAPVHIPFADSRLTIHKTREDAEYYSRHSCQFHGDISLVRVAVTIETEEQP
jgi:hypothetical protein